MIYTKRSELFTRRACKGAFIRRHYRFLLHRNITNKILNEIKNEILEIYMYIYIYIFAYVYMKEEGKKKKSLRSGRTNRKKKKRIFIG